MMEYEFAKHTSISACSTAWFWVVFFFFPRLVSLGFSWFCLFGLVGWFLFVCFFF